MIMFGANILELSNVKSVNVAILVYVAIAVLCMWALTEYYVRLVTRLKALDANVATIYKSNPLDVVLRKHRVIYFSDVYVNVVIINSYSWNVLLESTIGCTWLEKLHWLSAAYRIYVTIVDYIDEVSTVVTTIKLNSSLHKSLLPTMNIPLHSDVPSLYPMNLSHIKFIVI